MQTRAQLIEQVARKHLDPRNTGEANVLRVLATNSMTKAEIGRCLKIKNKTQVDRWVDSLSSNGLVLWDTHKTPKSRGVRVTASMLGLQVVLASAVGTLAMRSICHLKPEKTLHEADAFHGVFTPALVRIESESLQIRSPFQLLESGKERPIDWNPRHAMRWYVENAEMLADAVLRKYEAVQDETPEVDADIERLARIKRHRKQREADTALANLTTATTLPRTRRQSA